MRKSDALRWRDARAVFTLLGELGELGHDPRAWRSRMLVELTRLVGAKVGVASEAPRACAADPTRYVGTLDLGWDPPSERAAWTGTCSLTGLDADPCDERFRRVAPTSFTLVRPALADDRRWYSSPYAAERLRAAGIDHFILSHRRVPRIGGIHALLLYRAWGEPPFSPAEVRLIDRFHHELGRLWREAPEHPLLSLAPRLRQTLTALGEGDSEKQVADRLGVSTSTVHDYVKALYRHFGVHSRGELLARSLRMPRYPVLEMELGAAPKMTPGAAPSAASERATERMTPGTMVQRVEERWRGEEAVG